MDVQGKPVRDQKLQAFAACSTIHMREKPSQDTTLTRHEICDPLMYLLHTTHS